MPFTTNLGHVFHIPELQAAGGAGGHTGRAFACIHPVLAVITFFHFSRVWIPLGRTPGAGRHTGFTPYAEILVDKYNPVMGPFLHGPGGTGRHTPWIFTVKTGHENKGYLGQPTDKFRAHLDDLAGFWTLGKVLIGFALDLTGMTPNTFFCVLVQIIFAH